MKDLEAVTPEVDLPVIVEADVILGREIIEGEIQRGQQHLRQLIVSRLLWFGFAGLGLGGLDMILRASAGGYVSPDWLGWLFGAGGLGVLLGFFTSTSFADWLFRRRPVATPHGQGADARGGSPPLPPAGGR